MKRTPINLFLEQGPVDSFDPKSPQKYRVVGVVEGDRNRPEEVMVLSPSMGDPSLVLDSFRRSIAASVTRFEAEMYLRDMKGMLNGVRALDTRTEALKTHMILNARRRKDGWPLEGDTREWPAIDVSPPPFDLPF